MSKKKQPNEHIQVFVRCRPLTKQEFNESVPVEVHPEVNKILVRDVLDRSIVKTYSFDKVFGHEASQADVYNEVVAPVVEEVISGFNCTIFAYGQTGTGKTYTIEGSRSSALKDRSEDPLSGIIPRSMFQIFNELTSNNTEFDVCVTFLELYNEEIFDLLSNSDSITKLKIFDNSTQKGSVIVQGLQIVSVTSMSDVYDILDKGSKKRKKAATLLNKASSRSHTIFTVTVNIKESSSTLEKVLSGKLNLVDLAGSENIGRSGAIDKRAREAGNINQSLLALGRVITSLSNQASHIPYRESKLTRLLQDSLGGQTKTAVIATISPSAIHLDETLNTLDYALRAKSIKNLSELNTKVTPNSLTQDYLEEINRLRKEISKLGSEKGYHIPEDHIEHWESTLKAKRDEKFKILSQIKKLDEESILLDKAFMDESRALNEKKLKLESMTKEIEERKKNLEEKEKNIIKQKSMIQILNPMIDCLHEKFHKDVEKKNACESELKELKEKIKCGLKEQRSVNATLKGLSEQRMQWHYDLCRCSENLINDIRNADENLNLMASECNNYVDILKNGYESRVQDCEKEFENLFKSINYLETTHNLFSTNIETAIVEEKSAKLKSIEEFQEAYLSMDYASVLQPLDKAVKECETSLRGICTAVEEWKNDLTSEIDNQSKCFSDHLANQKKTLESTINCVNALLSKQNEDLETCNNIIAINFELDTKKHWTEKFLNVEQALSSLDIHCTDYIKTQIDKSTQVQPILRNCSENRSEIVKKIADYYNGFSDSIDSKIRNVSQSIQNMFKGKLNELKGKVDTSCTKYKELNSELTKYSSTSENREEISKDIEDSLGSKFKVTQQAKVPFCIQEMSSSILKCGDSLKSSLTKNQSRIDESLSADKLQFEKLTETSKELSNNMNSKLTCWIQNLESDFLRNLTVDADKEINNTTLEETIQDTTFFDSEETITETNCTENFVRKNDCPVCLSKDREETLQADAKCSTSDLSPNVQLKSFKSPFSASEIPRASSFSFPVSPIKRPSNKKSLYARKTLQFLDVEKITHELLESSGEEE